MKKWFVVGLVLLLSACSNNNESVEQLFDGMNGKEVLEVLAEDSIKGISASVYDNELVVRTEDSEFKYEMPKDEFYIAVAPYENSTHPWLIHSATGCRGELVEKTFDVLVKDKNGKEIFNDKVTSLKNGFFELWLPRGIEGTLTVNYNGKSSVSAISTYAGDLTCLTTMELR